MFLDAGYTPSLFWDSCMDEIIDMLESANRREKRSEERLENSKKLDALLNSVLARQIQERIGLMLPHDGEAKLTPLYELFPHWFSVPKEEQEKEARQQLELHKAKMENFMFWNNQKFNKGGE